MIKHIEARYRDRYHTGNPACHQRYGECLGGTRKSIKYTLVTQAAQGFPLGEEGGTCTSPFSSKVLDGKGGQLCAVGNKRESLSPCGAVTEGGVSGCSRLMQSSRGPPNTDARTHARTHAAPGPGSLAWQRLRPSLWAVRSTLWLLSANPIFAPFLHLILLSHPSTPMSVPCSP